MLVVGGAARSGARRGRRILLGGQLSQDAINGGDLVILEMVVSYSDFVSKFNQ